MRCPLPHPLRYPLPTRCIACTLAPLIGLCIACSYKHASIPTVALEYPPLGTCYTQHKAPECGNVSKLLDGIDGSAAYLDCSRSYLDRLGGFNGTVDSVCRAAMLGVVEACTEARVRHTSSMGGVMIGGEGGERSEWVSG